MTSVSFAKAQGRTGDCVRTGTHEIQRRRDEDRPPRASSNPAARDYAARVLCRTGIDGTRASRYERERNVLLLLTKEVSGERHVSGAHDDVP